MYDALNMQAKTLEILSKSMGADSNLVSQQVNQIDGQQDEITDDMSGLSDDELIRIANGEE